MATPSRVRNWDIHLYRWARDVTGEPFEWGRTDCGSLVRESLAAMYPDKGLPLAGPPPAYSTEREALRVHAETGGVEGWVQAAGWEPVSLGFACQGDVIVGLGDVGGVPGAAVVVAGVFLVASESDGVVARRLRDLRAASPGGVTVYRPPWEGADV